MMQPQLTTFISFNAPSLKALNKLDLEVFNHGQIGIINYECEGPSVNPCQRLKCESKIMERKLNKSLLKKKKTNFTFH